MTSGYEEDMLRIRLIENRTGTHVADVNSPEVPRGEQIVLNLPEDRVREFYIEGVVTWVFSQDGPSGALELGSVDLAVTETLDSRRRVLEGRTAS